MDLKNTNIIEYVVESSKDHLENGGDNSQDYFTHCRFACMNSAILIYGGVIGIIHGLLPFLFKFQTSEIVIKSMRKLIDSGRHKKELRDIMPQNYVLQKHMN